jgi:hypothetical protein
MATVLRTLRGRGGAGGLFLRTRFFTGALAMGATDASTAPEAPVEENRLLASPRGQKAIAR